MKEESWEMDGDNGKVVQVSCVFLVGFVSELRWSYCCQWRGSYTGDHGEGATIETAR